MAHVSHKLSGSLQGALAGGGDPATSPLYVFGPFLRMIVVGGVAGVTFGASIWLAVVTVVAVSGVYRLVMRWVTDGSGGTGLNEEEFGAWAVKVNASVTIIEYTLTFLVSMAALVTFVADRLPALNQSLLRLPGRTWLAVGLSLIVGFVVNRGPKAAARAFGPATAAVLLLLWAMILATVRKLGFHLPRVDPAAFRLANLHFTLGGYARILALMTGIEIFANLVAAYEGSARERSRKAFASLVIVMGTTLLTMLVVGPAILRLANPLDPRVSVFTQTMDRLLPAPIAYLGTMIGVAVLLSAAAASAQGIQNLSLGLRYRHYLPASLGQRNRFEVAALPVWLQVGVCTACFLLLGTHEETYLSLYAAGVFVLLSLTAWAVVKRLARRGHGPRGGLYLLSFGGAIASALLATMATGIIVEDRFRDGVWIYVLLIPGLYWLLGRFRRVLGAPPEIEDRIGRPLASSTLPPLASEAIYAGPRFDRILAPLDRSPEAERALAVAQTLARAGGGELTLLSILEDEDDAGARTAEGDAELKSDAREHLADLAERLAPSVGEVHIEVRSGDAPAEIGKVSRAGHYDAIVMSTPGRSRLLRWLVPDVTSDVIYQTTPPLIVVRPTDDWKSTRTWFKHVVVALDASSTAEQVLPYVRGLASQFHSEVVLVSVPEGSESDAYPGKLAAYLERIAASLRTTCGSVRVVIEGTAPAQVLLEVARREKADLIMMVSHGRGGVERQAHVKLGSVVADVLDATPCPVFLVSAAPAASPHAPANRL